MTGPGRVDSIWRYPVSSTGGEQLAQAQIEADGIDGDRRWGIADRRDGSTVNPYARREWRPIPNIRSRLGGSGAQIAVPSGDWLDAGSSAASQAISQFLGFEADLLPHVPYGSIGPNAIAPHYQRSDLLLITSASLARLGQLLENPAQVDPIRFRPNIVLATPAATAGFIEQEWIGRQISIGKVRLKVREPCARCPFVTLAQGRLSFMPAVLQTISQEANGNFGVYCDVVEGGMLSVGDTAVFG